MSLLPTYIVQEKSLLWQQERKKTVPREYEIDFNSKRLTGRIVEGIEAIKIWIWLALQTPRYRYYIYSWDYGSEIEELIGNGYSEEYIKSEVRRMTEECLLVNENIKSISEFSVVIEGSYITISFIANTLYGNIEVLNERIVRVA